MKKALTILCASLLAIILLSCDNNGGNNGKYVNLGLPSGTLWAAENAEGPYYYYPDALATYGNSIPTKEQIEELIDNCEWTWDKTGYKVVGPNGKSIFFPALGNQDDKGEVELLGTFGFYWSCTPEDGKSTYALIFCSDTKYSPAYIVCWSASYNHHCAVRLVK